MPKNHTENSLNFCMYKMSAHSCSVWRNEVWDGDEGEGGGGDSIETR